LALSLAACGFPRQPGEGNLLNMSLDHHKEIFEQGGRGQIIMSMTDNLSDDSFLLGIVYDNVMVFQNKQTGEQYFLKTKLGSKKYATAMLPLGEYEVSNLYMRYTYQTRQQMGNTVVVTTHVVTYDHFEQGKVISFDVKPGEVIYIGNFEMIKPEKGSIEKDGSLKMPGFKLTDKSGDIGQSQVAEWKTEFGKPFEVRLAKVRAMTAAEHADKKMKQLAREVD
jgi:hypothetical protein